ncbi:MAG: NAD(P)/FAD-dependent oxidoreductase [Marinobacter sp.]|uniref:flavin-containing monooxygenase n=1 Tax=Marinobacter sp. TaxID=50741 RepID=UPI00299DCEF0|nr:NAD(P)/FAD-dependent oxidoreductase [Marinobacter sp.]MDX1756077.1 NAD(P)/FAD-dependent oxidoreductase [Marinobacter sp.]
MHEHYDVLILGAGLSGIGMACHLTRQCPDLNFALLERRQAIGGTWDLFRYPGIRSDSDMFSFGYEFRPWNELKVLADGPSIKHYIIDTARAFGIEERIRFGVEARTTNWRSEHQHWAVTGYHSQSGDERTYTCNYLVVCTGYYRYSAGYLPDFPGIERFQGRCIHPQQWPEGLDYRGKQVVVIGSGATAMTLVPAMAADTARITLLQRSPSYVFALPSYDAVSAALLKVLPEKWVYQLARQRNILLQLAIYKGARRFPSATRRLLLRHARKQLGKDFEPRHFTPRYNPWDQRICPVPDGNLFKVLRAGQASIETDEIDTFTETGVRLKSGKDLPADIVITATGLQIELMGGMAVSLDGHPCDLSERLTYKGVLVEGLPNLGWIFGYTNASWTLKADLAANYLCRLLNHMQLNNLQEFVPRDREGSATERSVMDSLSSGYIRRASGILPRQGARLPWRVLNDYGKDRSMLLNDPIDDGYLEFSPTSAG